MNLPLFFKRKTRIVIVIVEKSKPIPIKGVKNNNFLSNINEKNTIK
jgi:hypothetical protein